MLICWIFIKIGQNVREILTNQSMQDLNENSKYFSREVPELDNNRTILFCQTSK